MARIPLILVSAMFGFSFGAALLGFSYACSLVMIELATSYGSSGAIAAIILMFFTSVGAYVGYKDWRD